MKNILIYSEKASSSIEDALKENDEFSVRIKPIAEIKEMDTFNPSLVVLETSELVAKNTIATTKFKVPLLIVSDKVLDLNIVRAEGYDYILNPVNIEELKVRVATLLKIQDLKQEVEVVSSTDELTGLYNRKYLHERLESELSRAKRYGLNLSCLLVDIDFFKVVNDMYGYDWGDVLLKKVAEILEKHVRKEDILVRYGDEEFIIVLPNTNEENAYVFSERLRRDVERMEFIPDNEEERHPITISGGLACYPYLENVDESANTIIRYAEHALYNAKKRGKNKIVQFSQINIEL